jgi:hypothetical protein
MYHASWLEVNCGAGPVGTNVLIEQPTKFEFMTNSRTAKVLSPTIPRSLVLRADEVIQ